MVGFCIGGKVYILKAIRNTTFIFVGFSLFCSVKDNLLDSVGLPYHIYMNFQRLT